MIVKEINIDGIGGISNSLKLSFHPQVNIICGRNGIGKTTILEAVAQITISGTYYDSILKKNVDCEKGTIHSTIEDDGEPIETNTDIAEFSPTEGTNLKTQIYHQKLYSLSKKIISFKTFRTFNYKNLKSICKDPERHENYINSQYAAQGIPLNDIKDWFVNRYLYHPHPNALSDAQTYNFEKAKECFSILNPSFSFSRVEASSNDVMVNTPNGEIYYEYLSSGFKSTLSILLGIMKEIEYRNKDQKVDDFDGIILIDEVELHLHPEWQEKIMEILTKVFPKVQFFVTTHSPHIIQNAEANQIIALYFDEKNNICQKDVSDYEYGFKGWTIEEILTDVMGMQTLRTELFTEKLKEFGIAVDEENYEKAKEIYNFLKKILHPQNELRKLLELQLIAAV
ncbi:recombinase RecF [Capnocytophaga canimorsus]|uniref:Recombinase RecF n=1 Tax=Capnocytophaga canimorsus TaxID=28188 RepID=A0A250G1S3_9FLAO|nr:AAA family ATPase [Capnocytophaga canimorsus]ATA91359.1 recombinase RecF [Capnocytophaga canimorsus]